MDEIPFEYYPDPHADNGGHAAFARQNIPHLHSFELADVIEIDLEPEDDFAPYGARIYVRICRHCDEISEQWHEPGSLLVGEAEESSSQGDE